MHTPGGVGGAGERFQETFAGDDTPAGEWISGARAGSKTPCLTAGTGKTSGGIPACPGGASDGNGSGTLQLTSNDANQSGFVFNNSPRQSGRGASIEFDMYQYDGKPSGKPARGGDGISFFLIDGAASPTQAGGYGAGLGYSSTNIDSKRKAAGLKGGLVGVGFDQYGNFSKASFDALGSGTKAAQLNNVVIRGGEQARYTYVKGQKADGPLALDASRERSSAKRHVKVQISTANYMTVDVDYGKGPVREIEQDLDGVKGQPKLPETYKFGFAASTGNARAIHQISGLTVRTLLPNLQTSLRPKSEFKAGGTGSIGVSVKSTKLSGPTSGEVSMTMTLPKQLQPVSTERPARGDGWTCDIDGQTVTCTRPGTGADTLQPGKSYPEITIDTAVAPDASGEIPLAAESATHDEFDPADNLAKGSVKIAAAPARGPDLAASVTPVGDFTSPGTGSYRLESTNASDAGPTTGTVTQTFTVPDGQTVTGVKGDGWTCDTAGQKVTCTRKDPLGPGRSYLPVQVDVANAAGMDGPVKAVVHLATPGDTNSANDTDAAQVPIKNQGPDLSTALSAEGDLMSPGGGVYRVDVANAKGAGPTYRPTTETITIPDGQTVKGASGDGWECTTSGQKVTCTRPDALAPAEMFPPIRVKVDVPPGVTAPATVSATADTAGDVNADNNTATAQIPVKANGPDLSTTIGTSGDLVSPGEGAYTVDVSNAKGAGTTYRPTTETITIPDGQAVKGAGGDGWTCSTSGQKVTCTRPDALKGGEAFPTITVRTAVPAGATGPVTVTATSATTGDVNTKNDTATAQLPIKSKGPDLTVGIAAEGEFTAPGTGTYKIDVSNAKGAGPSYQPDVATLTVPDGQVIKGVTGDGWECETSGQQVTCTNPAVLQPGRAHPPIRVDVQIPAGTAGPAKPTVKADTKGETDPSDNTAAAEIPIRILGPDLSTVVTREGEFTSPGTGVYQADVHNDRNAGPTTGPATETFVVPDGQTPREVTGDGWKCTTSGQQIACTREDVLQPGASYPPIKITVDTAAGVRGPLSPKAVIKTPGDTEPRNDTAPPLDGTVKAYGPDLNTKVAADGVLSSPGGGVYKVYVANAKGAAPTVGAVTGTVTIPDGQAIKAATGDGWECTPSGQKVTCTRPGNGDDVLKPGVTYPSIKVTVDIPAGTDGPSTVTATSTTTGELDPSDNTAKAELPIRKKGPDLSTVIGREGEFVAPGRGVYTLDVGNDDAAGPSTDPVTATFTVPDGQTPGEVTGEGWDCGTSGQKVTCTRTDGLQPGATFPTVRIPVDTAASTTGPVKPAATVATKGDVRPANDTAKAEFPVRAKGPDLTTKVTPKGEFTSPGEGVYQVDVSNAPDAGPSTGPATESITVPVGQKVTSADGDGWDCTTAGRKVTCRRTDPLKPGESYPPVLVKVAIPAGTAGPARPTAHVDTKGDTDTDNNTAPSVEVPIRIIGPDLTTVVTPVKAFTSPGTGTYRVDVSNAKGAGPTYQKVTETFVVPDGQTVTKAAGPGWDCRVTGQKVTCTRPGTGDDALDGGSAFPPIQIDVKVDEGQVGTVYPRAVVDTPGDVNPKNNACDAKKGLIVGPAVGPNLSVTARQLGDVVAGQPATFQLEVANAADTEPTDGPVTVKFPMPKGIDVTTVSGTGWKCVTGDYDVTCTRPGTGDDALQPGDSYPMIEFTGNVCADGACTPQVSASVAVKDEIDPSDNKCGPARVLVLTGNERRTRWHW
ncbi:hypothetical protein J4573_49215 [Actinomadura barringtoniae]|uniref:DUF11 domain-containing protein n=1 Tax=Actinomadura barringtoniae TaxID=1427535 RepID=A0A939PN76_9ACTN|nr:hypothetical protein [Actinomadura barringtoniae]MBO2455143.1 hypothetical protein [Actinomadura barringtoniae]